MAFQGVCTGFGVVMVVGSADSSLTTGVVSTCAMLQRPALLKQSAPQKDDVAPLGSVSE